MCLFVDFDVVFILFICYFYLLCVFLFCLFEYLLLFFNECVPIYSNGGLCARKMFVLIENKK